MAVDEQVPRLSELLTPGIDALVAIRPNAARHIAEGRYGAVVEGLAAQAALCRARLADECASARLELAELGLPLYDLVTEYGAVVDPNPKPAIGECVIRRSVTNTSPLTTGNWGNFGVIPAGSRFRRPGDTAAVPPREDATYVAAEPVLVPDEDTSTTALGGGSYEHIQVLDVPIVADRTGPHANTVLLDLSHIQQMPAAIVDPLFDSSFEAIRLAAAGGSNGPGRIDLIAYAKAAYAGQYGPTDSALIAGAFSFGGVKRLALQLDPETAIATLWCTDESWGGSRRFAEAVQNGIVKDWLGFGGRVQVGAVRNVVMNVACTVILSSPNHAGAANEISANIRKRVLAYFDDRADWWAWKTQALRGIVARADRRILTCTSGQVLNTGGVALTEPSGVIDGTPTHYLLADKGVRITFQTPS